MKIFQEFDCVMSNVEIWFSNLLATGMKCVGLNLLQFDQIFFGKRTGMVF
jgi:hypothetical protein